MTNELPHATVATIVEKDNKFLLVRERSQGRLVYNQPAGHIENGESILAAAIRETYEETGWHVSPKAFIGVSIYHAPNGITYVRNTLSAAPTQHDADAPLDDGIEAAVWLSHAEIVELKAELRSPIVLKVIEDYMAGKSYPLDLLYEHR
jgi:8-oxo-dGTP pyrophosphatase MutT (NUDIX family)